MDTKKEQKKALRFKLNDEEKNVTNSSSEESSENLFEGGIGEKCCKNLNSFIGFWLFIIVCLGYWLIKGEPVMCIFFNSYFWIGTFSMVTCPSSLEDAELQVQ